MTLGESLDPESERNTPEDLYRQQSVERLLGPQLES